MIYKFKFLQAKCFWVRSAIDDKINSFNDKSHFDADYCLE